MSSIDALKLGLIWNRLITIADEMTGVLIKTAFSTVVNESHDCACILTDKNGNSIAQSSHALPAFMGTMPVTAKEIVRLFGGSFREGDVIVTNDPWIAGGHLPDLTVVSPVFLDGEMIALTVSTAHLPDIGGKVWSADCNEVYEEGFRIAPMKIFDAGKRNETFFHLLKSNVRVYNDVEHDIMAQVNAHKFGAMRLIGVLRRYSDVDIGTISREILERSEKSMRDALRAIPEGAYEHRVELDGFEESIALQCKVTVKQGEVGIDFSGSSPQQQFGINSVIHYTRAYASYAIKCLLNSESPCNEGSFRPIAISAPLRSVVNAQFPAAVGGRHLTGMFVPFAIYGALAKAVPQFAMADSGLPGSPYFTICPEAPDGSQRTIAQFFSSNGGMGARWGSDGVSTCSFPTNISNVPIEVVEARSDLIVERRELTQDSGGAGRWRGGLGQTYVIRVPGNFVGKAWVSMLSDRTRHPALGQLAGEAGSLRLNLLNDVSVHPKKRVEIHAGDLLEIRMPGGGGVGDPHMRDRSAIEQDLEGGYISAAAALKNYAYEAPPKAAE
jgi:N-methylhydantoinase B